MGLFSSPLRDPAISHRLSTIERKLDAIMEHLAIELPADGFDEVRRLAEQGRKIEAIKLYREQTGYGLTEAKAFVDSL